MGFSNGSAQGFGAQFTLSRSRMALALVAAMASWGAHAAQPAEYAKGRVIVQTHAGLSDEELDKIVKVHGGKARRIGKSNLHIVDLPGNASETAVQAQLAHNPHLKFAELDRKVQPDFAANDPYLGSAWHLNTLKAASAWDVSQGGSVTIAILDSGVLATHADLAPNLVPGWNAYDGSNTTSPVTYHGTAVAGAAAAVTNNGAGVAGVAGQARIMPIRITDAAGTAYYSTIASGITYAADHGVRVVNCSYSGLFKTASILSAGAYLKSKGGLLVVSAGNGGIDENAAATTSMITVSATDGSDNRTSWSSFGQMVSVAAPGAGIWTTNSDGAYTSANGTSFSSPIVAGVVALMMSANPSLGAAQIESLLFSTAVDLGAAGKDIYFGYGRVDADAAVRAARSATGADTQAPVASVALTSGSTVSGLVSVNVNATDNVAVSKVNLLVNGSVVGTDTGAPYQFSWDSSKSPNGAVTLTAVAYDAAGNAGNSAPVSLTVANALTADTTPPVVTIANPINGSQVSGTVSVSVQATDNAGSAALKQSLYLDGALVASGSGGSLSYNWNSRKASAGIHTLTAIGQDAAGNKTTTSVQVSR
ncbi:S8 family serine peptidase [Roseateles violae]|uniref:S8 family serine peptidase n=1 Tax=Roseateles violae TaxID=3058042 RepID=A0ABT8DV23_9BURK|nr:S8 family serine peptidase [Pelomonas sp. PFR6]MDN3920144.1 S8 family serine peptidase [Pelomonas sp. PFR6]